VPDGFVDNASAFAINARGQVAGSAEVLGTGEAHAVLWSEGTLTDLGTVDGIPYSAARAINASGQVVGTADPYCSPCAAPRAWTWQPGTAVTPLDSLVAPGSGWTLRQANGINDAGQIVGAGLHDGAQHAFLLTPSFHVNVNFQPPGARTPAGYRADTGGAYGLRGGLVYGWRGDNTAGTRDRNSGASPDQRYDTLIHLQKPGGATTWELAVPNGSYLVHLVSGDACCTDSVFRLKVESVVALSGTPSTSTHWLESTVRVTVTDGRLTVTNAPGSSNDKLNYLDVVSSP
jgi:probable HAF family extracellular repeat protein